MVLMDGKAVNACLVLAFQAESKALQTIEGLGSPERLHPLQDSLIRNGEVQCGLCTAGILMSAVALLEKNPDQNTGEIKRAISDILFRCAGYVKIIKAVQDAAA